VDLTAADGINVNWTEKALYTNKWHNFLTVVISPHEV